LIIYNYKDDLKRP